jgi:Rieske Fe-S protein
MPLSGNERTPRRDFLSKALWAWSVLIVAPIAKVIADFVTPRIDPHTSKESIRVATTSDLARNSAKIFKVNKEPVIVVHTERGQYRAFNARCTHLGCVIQYSVDEETPHFNCNCHGSQFDLSGRNIVGPASRPLTPYKVLVRDSSIFVSKA